MNKLGNYHCNNRVYSIGQGRWLSPDQAAHPFFNLFDCCRHQPTRRIDPNGLKPFGRKGAEDADDAYRGDVRKGTRDEKRANADSARPPQQKGKKRWLCIASNAHDESGKKDCGDSFRDGHANLVLLEYDLDKDEGTYETYGTFPDDHPDVEAAGLSNGDKSDIRKNFWKDAPDRYPYIYCEEITDSQLDKFKKAIEEGSQWSGTNNCASFASEVFEDVTGTELDADDFWGLETPRELGESITDKLGDKANNWPRDDKGEYRKFGGKTPGSVDKVPGSSSGD